MGKTLAAATCSTSPYATWSPQVVAGASTTTDHSLRGGAKTGELTHIGSLCFNDGYCPDDAFCNKPACFCGPCAYGCWCAKCECAAKASSGGGCDNDDASTRAVTKRRDAFKMHFLCGRRGAIVFLNIPSKFLPRRAAYLAFVAGEFFLIRATGKCSVLRRTVVHVSIVPCRFVRRARRPRRRRPRRTWKSRWLPTRTPRRRRTPKRRGTRSGTRARIVRSLVVEGRVVATPRGAMRLFRGRVDTPCTGTWARSHKAVPSPRCNTRGEDGTTAGESCPDMHC